MATPTPAPINVFLDSDGPVADFDKALQASGMHTDDFKLMPGIYLWLDRTPGAAVSIAMLKTLDDQGKIRVWILTKTPTGAPYAYTEKVLWYSKHFPWLEDRVILTHDKSMVGCDQDFLLDDRPHKANVEHFRGTFVYFDVEAPTQAWQQFVARVNERVQGH
jgi:5'(3')-deoxyribonucleotidase